MAQASYGSGGRASALIVGLALVLGLATLGYLLGEAALAVRDRERSVTVKGLDERTFPADVVIWPIQFSAADNDLAALYQSLDRDAARIRDFLIDNGVAPEEITLGSPAITDRSAQQYGGDADAAFRFTARQSVTVYSEAVVAVRALMGRLSALGRQGIVLTGGDYSAQTEYLFTRLNAVKPEMIEAATRKAREVAQKFADDSDSRLGKIRRASQGQFSISARDQNNPHIKRVRVVSTVEYYLVD